MQKTPILLIIIALLAFASATTYLRTVNPEPATPIATVKLWGYIPIDIYDNGTLRLLDPKTYGETLNKNPP